MIFSLYAESLGKGCSLEVLQLLYLHHLMLTQFILSTVAKLHLPALYSKGPVAELAFFTGPGKLNLLIMQ